jgi:hypothetical protein
MHDKLTIVGPEPSEKRSDANPVSVNIESLLLMAKYDEVFRRQLLHEREHTISGAGIPFTEQEKRLLLSVSDKQLQEYITAFTVKGITKRSLKSWACAASVILLVPTILSHCGSDSDSNPAGSKGIEPDRTDIVLPQNEQY